MMEYAAAACIGFLLDFFIGDPEGWWHPVRTMGWLIEVLEKRLRRLFPQTKHGELAAGGILVCCVAGAALLCSVVILTTARLIHPAVRFTLLCVMSGQILAARSLWTESMKVCKALEKKDVETARHAVSMIVGRDTDSLTAEGITKAAVETVAENTSDGVIAPLLFLLFFGPSGGLFYKAVNTMDSMVGYRSERYQYFGKAAARLDDLVNWIPARLTALCFILTAWLLPGYDGKGAFRIWRRDRRCHKSPNSAQGEAACAGALGVCLGGDAYYFGVLCRKPVIGDGLRIIETKDIVRANQLMYIAAVLALSAGTGGILWITKLMGVMFTGIGLHTIFLSI